MKNATLIPGIDAPYWVCGNFPATVSDGMGNGETNTKARKMHLSQKPCQERVVSRVQYEGVRRMLKREPKGSTPFQVGMREVDGTSFKAFWGHQDGEWMPAPSERISVVDLESLDF